MPWNRPSPARRWSACPRAVVVLSAVILGVLGVVGLPVGAAAYPMVDDRVPELVLPSEAIFVLGRTGESYEIEADGDPVPDISVSALPAGLRLVAHADGSATIDGTPRGPAGETVVAVTARSRAGTVTEDLVVSVHQAPQFVGAAPLTFVAEQFGTVVVRTAGYPAPGINLEGELPGGLTFLDNGDGTATIAGTPVDGAGGTPVTVTATNVVADVSLSTRVTVVVRPEVTGGPVPVVPVVPVQGSGPRREP